MQPSRVSSVKTSGERGQKDHDPGSPEVVPGCRHPRGTGSLLTPRKQGWVGSESQPVPSLGTFCKLGLGPCVPFRLFDLEGSVQAVLGPSGSHSRNLHVWSDPRAKTRTHGGWEGRWGGGPNGPTHSGKRATGPEGANPVFSISGKSGESRVIFGLQEKRRLLLMGDK